MSSIFQNNTKQYKYYKQVELQHIVQECLEIMSIGQKERYDQKNRKSEESLVSPKMKHEIKSEENINVVLNSFDCFEKT